MVPDLTLYLVTRFASQANRRLVQLTGLRGSVQRVRLVAQRKGGTYDDVDVLKVDLLPGPTSCLTPLGFSVLRQRVDQHLYFPSPGIRYARAARAAVESEIRATRGAGGSAVVVTMVPPHDLVALGLGLKRRNPAVPWIIDWGDLWTSDEYYFERLPCRFRSRARELEWKAMTTCDANVVSNAWAAQFLVEELGVPQERMVVIPHAFEPGDARPARGIDPMRESGGPIRLGFLGSLFKPPKVPGDEIIRGLERVRNNGLDVELHVVGDKHLIRSPGAGSNGRGWLKAHEVLPHERSLDVVAQCDFLLVALADLPNCRRLLPAKLAPYLALNRPILAVVPDPSATAEVLRDTGAGYVIPARDEWWDGVAKTLRAHAQDALTLRRRPERIQEFSFSRFAGQWLDVIAKALR